MNFAKIKQLTLHYLYGCFASGWNSASLTAKAYVTLTVGNNVDPTSVPQISWHALVYMWGASFVLFGVLDYFAKNPLPDRLPDTKPPFNQPVP